MTACFRDLASAARTMLRLPTAGLRRVKIAGLRLIKPPTAGSRACLGNDIYVWRGHKESGRKVEGQGDVDQQKAMGPLALHRLCRQVQQPRRPPNTATLPHPEIRGAFAAACPRKVQPESKFGRQSRWGARPLSDKCQGICFPASKYGQQALFAQLQWEVVSSQRANVPAKY